MPVATVPVVIGKGVPITVKDDSILFVFTSLGISNLLSTEYLPKQPITITKFLQFFIVHAL